MDLQFDQSAFRVTVSDSSAMKAVRERFADHVVELEPQLLESVPLAFEVRAPSGPGRLWMVVDRSGFVLGRLRTMDEAIAVLTSHLGVFERPGSGAARLRMRAVLRSDNTAALVGFPLMVDPAPVERRLARVGAAIVDRVAVDVVLTEDGPALAGGSTAFQGVDELASGHGGALFEPVPISSIIVPDAQPGRRTQAEMAAYIAHTVASTTSGQDLRVVCLKLAQLRVVSASSRNAEEIYAALGDAAPGW